MGGERQGEPSEENEDGEKGARQAPKVNQLLALILFQAASSL